MNKKTCPNCYADFAFLMQKSRLGCAFCYTTFSDEIIWHLRKLQKGKTEHKGKMPQKYDDPVEVFFKKCVENSFLGDHDKKTILKECGLEED